MFRNKKFIFYVSVFIISVIAITVVLNQGNTTFISGATSGDYAHNITPIGVLYLLILAVLIGYFYWLTVLWEKYRKEKDSNK